MKIESIKKIIDFKSLAHFLAEELGWPIIDPESVDVDDLVFEYQPDELGLSEVFAAKVQAIKQIRPLDANQPWSIYWIDFENKKLPLTVLRRILNVFVTKKRGNNPNISTSEMEDIMFVSGHGEDENRAITFAHFKRLDEVETIREFYWDGHETKFDHIASYLEKLEWPSDTADVDSWRKKWKSAFTGSTREAILTSDHLAKAMANIARNIRDRVLEVLEVEQDNGPVHRLFDTFRTGLVHDMTEKGFADMYAQTITYGLFSARTMDTDGHFELHEVIDLIPTTNPFLKNLFKECLSTSDKNHKIDLDELGVGRLVELFDGLNRSDGSDTMKRILDQFGSQTFSGQEDPVIHFYEGFLKEYDNLERVEKGVYYTPDPVVKFIVRSVNEQLKSEFGLKYGLADTTTWAEIVTSGRAEYPVDPNTGSVNKEWIDKIKRRAFVQILDPATGTGTFLKHVIEVILEEVKKKFEKEIAFGSWEDYWNQYVYNSLLPRIYGFELMMASYAVAHMKLGMFLKSTGYKFEKEQRLNIYLTNSLEPFTSNNSANLFFTSVGDESVGANNIKRNRYFSVVIGNPPYSGISNNKDPWITKLIEDYKYVNGVHFNEKKHWLNADEIKFIRLGQDIINRNGAGVLAFINPHSYLDNPTFRGMRWNLLKKFNLIHIVDLNGNSRNAKSKDGTGINNVFDIVQGVCVNIFTKKTKGSNSSLAKVSHFDLFGNRAFKYDFLSQTNINDIDFSNLSTEQPMFQFVPIINDNSSLFYQGFDISELFIENTSGIQTSRDFLAIDLDPIELEKRISRFIDESKTIDEVRTEFFKSTKRSKYLKGDSRGWKISEIRPKLQKLNVSEFIQEISYRPFDRQYICYTNLLVDWPREKVQRQMLKENLSITIGRQGQATGDNLWDLVFIQDKISDLNLFSRGGGLVCPLYIYEDATNQGSILRYNKRVPNLNIKHVEHFASCIKSNYTFEKSFPIENFSPIDILDYIYAVLHSNIYRKKFKEFLKADFPRVPYPRDSETFWALVKLGEKVRKVHLIESSYFYKFITYFPVIGNNELTQSPVLKNNKVYINNEQYFDGVPEVAWNFYIGGYQPAQKWLKDRKGRILTDEDINHYQKIIVALTETDRIMKEIDKIDFMDN